MNMAEVLCARNMRREESDENVITASIMQERYLNYSSIKRDKQSRLDTIGFYDYTTD